MKKGVMILAVKVTRKMIQDYVKTRKEVKLLERELYEMKTTDKGIGNSVIMDYRKGFPRPQSVVGFDMDKYERRRATLEYKADQCAAVEKWIEEIEDTQTRQVFELRYIKEQQWKQVAKKMGYKYEDYARIAIHDKYLDEAFEKK